MYNDISRAITTVYWIAHNNENIVHRGVLPPNGCSVSSGQPFLESFASEEEWLMRLQELGGDFTPLSGMEKLYVLDSDFWICPVSDYDTSIQTLVSAKMTPEQDAKLGMHFAHWLNDVVGGTVVLGTVREFNENRFNTISGWQKPTGILDTWVLKTDETQEFMVVPVKPLNDDNGERATAWLLGVGDVVPYNTIARTASRVAELLKIKV
jgi:hypothetical protein